MKTIRWGAALLAGVLFAGPAMAQQEPSLAEAARRARREKERAPKAEKVWTNDNLPSGPGAASAVGGGAPATTPSAGGGEVAAGAAATASPEQAKDLADTEKELAGVKQRLATAKTDLELLSRDYDLQRQQFYSNPGYAGDSAGKARLDGIAAQRNSKQQEVQQLQQDQAALEDKLKTLQAAAGPKPTEPTTPEQDRAAWVSKVRPLREELARVEGEINRIRSEAAAQGQTLYGTTTGGSMASGMLEQLENRRRELQAQIAQVEDDARRAGVPPAWLR
jgi:chromosome segregation ATPase